MVHEMGARNVVGLPTKRRRGIMRDEEVRVSRPRAPAKKMHRMVQSGDSQPWGLLLNNLPVYNEGKGQ